MTSKFHLQNADLDGNQYGIQVSGANTTGQMSNVTTPGPDGVGFNGLYITGSGSTVFCRQPPGSPRSRTTRSGSIQAGSSRLVIQGFWTGNWNQSGIRLPGH